ncbi:thioredoxin family protein [Bernardetia sp.]|uniref:thioredoxin family protein n=1 Tax=Bernardetia sp. TaxID=1937974 RepID=UPI0025C323F7|nr:thioredoxin family protein [Bernardetia sp.]
MEYLDKSYLEKSISYQEYRTLGQELLDKGTTTNGDKSPEILEYTNTNMYRMNRLDKTTKLNDNVKTTLENLPSDEKYYWVVMSESWCGDAAQIVPVMNKIAEEAGEKLDIRFLLRDENPDLIDAFLTNGGRAIPKLIFVKQENEKLKIIDSWGARPAEAQKLVVEYKEKVKQNPELADFKAFSESLHGWYAKDKTQSTQNELAELLKNVL